MATNFPSSLDAFTNPTSGDTLDSPDHAGQHADANDAIEALQAKVGVDGSPVRVVPATTVLGTITSRSSSTALVYFNAGTDFLFSQTFYSPIDFVNRSSAMATFFGSLPAGTILEFNGGMSTDANHSSATFVSYSDNGQNLRVTVSNTSANFNPTGALNSGEYVRIATYDVTSVTDNSSLALSEPYVEIDSTVFESSSAVVSGANITVNTLDASWLPDVGSEVVEKSNSFVTSGFESYNFSTGAYDDALLEYAKSFTPITWSHKYGSYANGTSAADYVAGRTHIIIPDEWQDWELEYHCSISIFWTASASYYVYFAPWIGFGYTGFSSEQFSMSSRPNGTVNSGIRTYDTTMRNYYSLETAISYYQQQQYGTGNTARNHVSIHQVINADLCDAQSSSFGYLSRSTFLSNRDVSMGMWINPANNVQMRASEGFLTARRLA